MPKPRRSANARTRARVPRGRAPPMSASCSEKLTADVALAHAPILQGPDDSSSEELLDNKSLKQLLIRNPKTELHNTINCSCSTYPLGPEKLLAGSAERFSVLPVQDPDVSSLDVFLDSSLEESITANQLSVPHNTIDGSSNTSPSSCGKLVAGTMESASAPILQGLDDLSLDDFLGSSSEESSEESNSPRTVPHNIANGSSSSAFSLGSILVRYPQKCLQMFYIRLDRSGSFWMYPYLGGPYKRIDDVDFAITLFDVTYRRDRTIRTKCLPDLAGDLNACYERNLVEALVDQYNDYHDISEGGALVLEDLLRMQMFFEEYRWYYHFNFTTEQLIAGKKLFFAEVSFTQGAKMYDVNSFCMIDSNEDGGGGGWLAVERLLWGIVLLIQFQAMCSVAASGSVDASPRVYISLCLLLFLGRRTPRSTCGVGARWLNILFYSILSIYTIKRAATWIPSLSHVARFL